MTAITSSAPASVSDPAAGRASGSAPAGTRFSESRLIPNTASMAWRSLITMARNPGEFYDVLIQPVLFTVMFAQLLGGAIAGDVERYLPTLVPGLMVVNALTTSQSAGVDLREDMDKGVFDRFRTVPMSRIAPVLGPVVTDLLRYLVCVCLTLLTGVVMGYRPGNGWSGAIGATVLTMGCAWAMCWVFLFLGTVFSSAQAVTSFAVIVLFPLTFLSSAMVPVSTLPSWLQVFVRHNPVSHIIDSSRYLLDGATGSTRDVYMAIIGSLVVLAAMAPLTIARYQRRNA
nr:ABC transporter permease [Actinomyces oricola]